MIKSFPSIAVTEMIVTMLTGTSAALATFSSNCLWMISSNKSSGIARTIRNLITCCGPTSQKLLAGQMAHASPSAPKKPAAQTQSAFAELPLAAAACSGQRLITPSRHHVSAGHSLHWPPACP
eukprot:390855-Rhodomonas_salina.1